MRKKKHRKIALIFKGPAHKIQLGIMKYAREVGWILDLSLLEYQKNPPPDWHTQLDGIISHHLWSRNIMRIIGEKRVPTVDFGPYCKELDIPSVFMDNKAIGEMAGRYLISKGFENIGYIKRANSVSGNERYNALKTYALIKGKTFFTLKEDSFIDELKYISKPIGIMGENDSQTSSYVMKCLDAGFKIPYELAFISVDNDPLFCELTEIPLTSIDSDMEGRGYRAAQLLDRLIDGQNPPENSNPISPKGVVERESTSIRAIPHMPTYKALEYIHKNFKNKNLSVTEAAKISGMCRRRLEDNFFKYVGHSMPNEILRLRLEAAKKLLSESDLKVYEIADKCGFSSSEHMTKTFKRKTGMTPKDFRN